SIGWHFNGKIENPRIFRRALNTKEIEQLRKDRPARDLTEELVAEWDFSANMASRRVKDISPSGLHADVVNMPTRAVAGHNWKHEEINFSRTREEYGAIYFHDDDLDDAGWEVDFEFHVPEGMPSGIYAARLRAGNQEDHVPFFIRPRKDASKAPIA